MAIEEKKKKATAKNATAAVEAKKRKGCGASRAVSKKLKVSTVAETSAASATPSASEASASAEDVSDGSGGRAPTPPAAETEKLAMPEDIRGGQGVEAADQPEPSAANPMPGVVSGDSSNSEGVEDAERGGVPPTGDAEAVGASQRWPATIEVEDVSDDEADSQPWLCFEAPPSDRKRSVQQALRVRGLGRTNFI
jgi:hypothetical protein